MESGLNWECGTILLLVNDIECHCRCLFLYTQCIRINNLYDHLHPSKEYKCRKTKTINKKLKMNY